MEPLSLSGYAKESFRRGLGQLSFWLLTVLVGIVAGLGAVAFRRLIGGVHNLFFLGTFSFMYDANRHTPASPWGPWIILAPVIGALLVAFLIKTFAPEAGGNGVPEVMEAIHHRAGNIRPVIALIKPLASALSIGTGGSAGREGPIVQIGSAFGSFLGWRFHVQPWQRVTMVAAGASGGIAATFNTPVGGILFAAELLLPEISARTLVPVALSTAAATWIGRLFLGAGHAFIVPNFGAPPHRSLHAVVLLACVGLGIASGLISAAFIKSIYWCEDLFEQKISKNFYLRHSLGMLLVGTTIYLVQAHYGHYYVEGVGYAAVQDVFKGVLSALPLLLLLGALKFMATSLTLGSGGSGGIFSPALFVGAMFGGAYGLLLKAAFPHWEGAAPLFAVAGMAAAIASATGAPLTAIVMAFELTFDYQAILPVIISVAAGYGIRKLLLKDSVYTMKLVRHGHFIPETLQRSHVKNDAGSP